MHLERIGTFENLRFLLFLSESFRLRESPKPQHPTLRETSIAKLQKLLFPGESWELDACYYFPEF